ncbi:MAG: N-6 DNA methylase [Luteibacter jiangsuensis]
MTFELDQYFTPRLVADRLLASCVLTESPRSCVDPACGAGDLLDAAQEAFGQPNIAGLDKDAKTIARLRKLRPSWTLSVANLMEASSYRKAKAVDMARRADFVLLNPPFSQPSSKHIESTFDYQTFRSSFAMTYLMRSLHIFEPRLGGAAIMPESSLYSDLDTRARQVIGARFEIKVLFELGANTFKGTRARTVAVQFIPRSVGSFDSPPSGRKLPSLRVALHRGILPVHLARRAEVGSPYLHSTDINRDTRRLDRFITNPPERSVRGWLILLPRVGVPKLHSLRAFFARREMYLSDCVIAIACPDRSSCETVLNILLSDWQSFSALYRGTAARYVTMVRLQEWLADHSIEVT